MIIPTKNLTWCAPCTNTPKPPWSSMITFHDHIFILIHYHYGSPAGSNSQEADRSSNDDVICAHSWTRASKPWLSSGFMSAAQMLAVKKWLWCESGNLSSSMHSKRRQQCLFRSHQGGWTSAQHSPTWHRTGYPGGGSILPQTEKESLGNGFEPTKSYKLIAVTKNVPGFVVLYIMRVPSTKYVLYKKMFICQSLMLWGRTLRSL